MTDMVPPENDPRDPISRSSQSARAAANDTQNTIVRTHFEDFGNSWGERYEHEPRKMSDLDLQLRRENAHRLLIPLLQERATPATILDLGCGCGNVLEGLPAEKIRAIGMDLAPEMVVNAARRRPADAFVAGDAACLPLRDNSVDVVMCIGVLEYVPDPPQVLAHVSRVLTPGGHLIISFPNRNGLFRRASEAENWVERVVIGTLNRVRGRSNEGLTPRYQHQRWSFRQVHRLLEPAGLKVSGALFNTYGLFGRFGHGRMALRMSRRLTHRWREAGWLSKSLAQTMVVRACKPG